MFDEERSSQWIWFLCPDKLMCPANCCDLSWVLLTDLDVPLTNLETALKKLDRHIIFNSPVFLFCFCFCFFPHLT